MATPERRRPDRTRGEDSRLSRSGPPGPMAETLCADSSASSRRSGRRADRATSATRAISASMPGSSARARSRRATKTPWTVSASAIARWRCSWGTSSCDARSARAVGERSTRSDPRSRTSTAVERKRTPRRARKDSRKGRLWPTMGASPTKSSICGATSPKGGEASTSAWVMPVYRSTKGVRACRGFTVVEKRSRTVAPWKRTSPTSMISSESESRPVVSRSRATQGSWSRAGPSPGRSVGAAAGRRGSCPRRNDGVSVTAAG